MPKLAVLARNLAVAGVLTGVLGGCAVYVPGPPPGPPGYYRGHYAPTPHYYHYGYYGYYGRPYFRRG